MNLLALSKPETQELEETTHHIMNYFHHFSLSETHPYRNLVGWNHVCGVGVNEPIKKQTDALSNLLGFRPVYHRNYEYRNAVWAFEWKSGEEISANKFLIYLSKRGFSLQIHPNFDLNLIPLFLKELEEIIIKKKPEISA